MKHTICLMLFAVASLLNITGSDAGVPSIVVKEVIDAVEGAAKQSGKVFDSPAAKTAAIEEAKRLAGVHGNGVLKVVQDGGLEMMPAIYKHGDEVVKIAMQASPQGRRALAMNIADTLPLARRVGVDAIELEAKVPGQAKSVFQIFGDDAGKVVAKSVAVEDLPRIIKYGEMSDNAATRQLLVEAYQKEGRSLFDRIPSKLVLAGGLSASMILGTYEMTATERAKADVLRNNPDIVRDSMNKSTAIWAGIALVILFTLLWRFGLMPWQRNKVGRQH